MLIIDYSKLFSIFMNIQKFKTLILISTLELQSSDSRRVPPLV